MRCVALIYASSVPDQPITPNDGALKAAALRWQCLALKNRTMADRRCPSDGAAAAHEVDDEHDEADDQQDVDQAATDVERKRPEQPQDKDDNGNGRKHGGCPS
jgi:hypothetical protein